MGKLVVVNNLTLDGVMQAPGRADEDTRGGFAGGGWATGYADEVMGREMGKGMASTGALLLGRRTYEDFFTFWPKQEGNAISEVLDNTQKFVASHTLTEPLPWKNSTLVQGDVAEAVAKLKAELDADLVVLGSGNLLRTLMRRDLVDEYTLSIHPLLLGTGSRMFDDVDARLELVGSVPTTTGVIIATYRPVR
jgi:dihydrofolate reductase